jgi:hypothetical protein
MAFSCWDGKNLDSPNHQDHVAHPEAGATSFAVVGGKCPASHPVKIPQVHYEVSMFFFSPSQKSVIVINTIIRLSGILEHLTTRPTGQQMDLNPYTLATVTSKKDHTFSELFIVD